MAAGIIVALMSTKRAIVAPTNREEMLLAIEEVSSILQGKTISDGEICPSLNAASSKALDITTNCSASNKANCHDVSCKAPLSCRGGNDYFLYSVSGSSEVPEYGEQEQRYFSFMINCEGQTI